jgi:peptide/nickel transport system permease protein
MTRLALRVAVRTAILYWCVLSLTFALLRLAPGDPATFLVPPGATAADAARLRATLGLDRPVAVQYARWLRGTLHADLGTSFTDGRPVSRVIRDALPVSLGLGLVSLLLSFLVGTLAGLWQAARRGSLADLGITTISVILVASPAYWLGLGAIACFTYLASTLSLPLWLRLPAVGMSTPGADLSGLARLSDLVRHSVLPVGLLAAIGAAGVARYVRTAALDVMNADWVRTARAKGLGERPVVFKHGVRSAMTPVVTIFGLDLGILFGGAILTETVFNIPGIGREAFSAIQKSDLPIVQGTVLIGAAAIIFFNLIVDVIYAFLDPRVRY